MQRTSQKQVRLEVNFELPLIPKPSERFLQCLLRRLVSSLCLLNVVYRHLSPSPLRLARNGLVTQKSLRLRTMLAALLHLRLANAFVEPHVSTVHPRAKDPVHPALQLLSTIPKTRTPLAATTVVMRLRRQDNVARRRSLPH